MTPWMAMIRKDLVLYFSNRRALLVSVAAPIAIAAFFGYLFSNGTQKPSRIPVALVNLDDSVIARTVAAQLAADGTLSSRETSQPEGIEAVRRGTVRALIVLPAGFGQQAKEALLNARPKPVVPIYFDPSQSMALVVIRGLLTQVVMQAIGQSESGEASPPRSAIARADNASTLPKTPAATLPTVPRFTVPFTAQVQEVTSKDNHGYNSYAHAFAGMGVQFVLFMGIELGVGLLLLRREGIWKRLRAAPVSRTLLLGSRMVSGTLIALTLLVLIFAAGIAFFGVRIEGNVLGFVGVTIAFAVLAATFGLLIAALGKTPEATRGLAIFATLAMVMLGGAWAPTFIFPPWLQTASTVMPTRWAIDGFDGMTWRGLGLDAALRPIGVLLGFSAAFALLAILRFDWHEA